MSTNRIKDLREDRDLRQSDVAKATGIDQRTLSNYETGKTNPDSYALIKLADFFDVSIDYLVGRTNIMHDDASDVAAALENARKALDEAIAALRRRSPKILTSRTRLVQMRRSSFVFHAPMRRRASPELLDRATLQPLVPVRLRTLTVWRAYPSLYTVTHISCGKIFPLPYSAF